MGSEKKMKIGFNKLAFAAILATVAIPCWAVGTIIAQTVFGLAAGSFAVAATAFAINMVISSIINKVFFPQQQPGLSGDSPNPGNRQQVPPATDNKLPIVYGDAWVGGTIVDLSITSNNQELFYVMALSEVSGDGGDTLGFGNVYWGGKQCIFDNSGFNVVSLYDESNGSYQDNVSGKLKIYLYRNGSLNPTNSPFTAIQVMQTAGLTYTWDSSKLMNNCAFAIIHITYNSDAGLTGIQQTKFNVINYSKYQPGSCLYDYLTNDVYGAALPASQIDLASFNELNAYSDELFTYTTFNGVTTTQPRFRFNGVVDTSRSIMDNLQDMASCCDCILKYNEVIGKWGVVVQKPTYTIAMALNDSNLTSAIQITPLDIAGSYNVIECKFPDKNNQDAFNSSTFDLAQIDPSLLFPNEPVNKQSVSLPLVNNDVQAQYLAIRMLKSGREDLQVQVNTSFTGVQLEAGDIVTITNANYGWVAKLFRVMKVTEDFASDGSVTAKLSLTEFNAAIYNDVPITQFEPAPNSGIGNPLAFGGIPVPVIVGTYPNATDPNFLVSVSASANGITQYAEIWYSAFSNPTESQLIFAGTTAVQPAGTPYVPGSTMPSATVTGVSAGNWYFFTRMVNSLGKSNFSNASAVLNWRPSTFQYSERYLSVRYADSITGNGFSNNPRNKTYYGLFNVSVATGSNNPSDYTWYAGNFETANYLLFTNRTNRKFSFAVGNAGFNNLGGSFVPSETSVYDTSIWSALEDGIVYIDLDVRTGQLIKAGSTAVSSADGLLSVTNNTSGSMIVSLEKFLNFGSGVYSKTFSAATLTIDVYGRVIGFTEPDNFYFTQTIFQATSGQTTFNVTHTVGNILVFRNGVLCDLNDYTETSTTVVMNNACAASELITVINMRAVSTNIYYEITGMNIVSSGSTAVVYNAQPYQIINPGDILCFSATQPDPAATPTTYTVQSIDTSTKTITFTTNISGATASLGIYRKRNAGATYAPFSRYSVNLNSASSYTPTNFTFNNGFELLYVNGAQLNEVDYDLTDGIISGFPSNLTGTLTIIQFSPNNFNVPASNITNTVSYSTNGALSYVFPNNPLAMAIYANGALLAQNASYDFTANSSGYNLNVAFNNNFTLLNQQTFARIGAA